MDAIKTAFRDAFNRGGKYQLWMLTHDQGRDHYQVLVSYRGCKDPRRYAPEHLRRHLKANYAGPTDTAEGMLATMGSLHEKESG